MISVKHRDRINRILQFGIFWLVFGILYTLLEKGLLADSGSYPLRGNPYDFKTNLVTISLSSVIMGLLMGTLEVYFLSKWFKDGSFIGNMLAKTTIYLGSIVLFLIGLNAITYARYVSLQVAGNQAALDRGLTLTDYTFWIIVVYIGATVTMSLLLAELGQHIGHGVLRNFFTGRYHKPREEDRIFMFLDMKSSTTIAEQMGHIAYFELLKRYYADMTEAIQESSGEIYQYVGDEVVITWTMEDGIRNNDCLACFFRIKAKLEREAARYQKDFGTVPGFKAGLHCGHVTTGEIGSMRKDIIFTGDVMNTTARIQSLCNENEVDLLVSDVLMKRLPTDDRYLVREIGERQLKGKDERVHLFTVGV